MTTISLPPLANWQDFERLCCDLWKQIWGVPLANLHGRLGQPQHGVDVFAAVDGGKRWVGVQCKKTKGGFLSKAKLEAEVKKARKFLPPLTQLVLAMTAENDEKAQQWAREITEEQLARGSFPVTIYGWDDICRELAQHPDLGRQYFPQFSWEVDTTATVGHAYLSNLFAELEPMALGAVSAGSHKDATRLHEVFVSLDVESGFTLPLDAKAHPMAAKLGRRYHAEAKALVKAKEISPLKDQPYSRRFTAVEVAAEAPRLVLIGPPGSGKSTFGRYLALCLAGERLGRKTADLALLNRDRASAAGVALAPELAAWAHGAALPFFVELRKLVADPVFPLAGAEGKAEHLFEHLVGRQPDGELRPLLQRALREENGVVVILDGLDETPAAESTRETLKEVIDGFARAWPSCRILVTSRPYAYGNDSWQLEGFAAERLAPFDEAKRAAFVQGWYEHLAQRGQVDRDLVEPRSADLIRQIESTPYLEPLAERPLMLTMITDLHTSTGGRLPGGRAALYERSVGLMLNRWNHERHGENVAERLGMDAGKLRQALERLAYEVHKARAEAKGEAAPITDVELWQVLKAERPKECKIDEQEVRDYLHQRSGILLSESPTTYRFPHRSYQEFLAACHLTKTVSPKLLLEETKADPALWREVFVLGVGRMMETSFAAWTVLGKLVSKFSGPVLDAGDDRFSYALLASLVLEETGLWKSAEDEEDQERLERIREWLQEAIRRGALSPVDRAQAGRMLGRLGDRRFGIGLGAGGLPEIDWVPIPPGTFQMGIEKRKVTLRRCFQIARYPVTNAQFQAFVDDGGYTKKWRKCWTEEGWKWKVKEKRQGPYDDLSEIYLLPNHPRVAVTWHEAWAFSRWLGERRGEPIFLPTEHQWERAARGCDGRVYPWGDKPDTTRMNIKETGIGSTCAVGMFPTGASLEGVLDLSGNVLEWMASPWEQEHNDAHAEKPADLAATLRAVRVLCGGSYSGGVGEAQLSCQHLGSVGVVSYELGFRLLQALAPSEV